MKKIFFLSLLCILSISSFAQRIFNSLEPLNGQIHEAFYVFINAEEKDLKKDLESVLKKDYSSSENKGIYTIRAEKHFLRTAQIQNIVLWQMDQKLVYLFQDKAGKSLNAEEIYEAELKDFILDMHYRISDLREQSMALRDLEDAKKQMEDAEKEANKLRSSIEKNLSDQEKLGKRIDATPEDLEKLIAEKEELLKEKLEQETEILEDKEMARKDKELVKRQKKQSKDEKKLAQREKQLDDLVAKYGEARMLLSQLKEVYESKKAIQF